MNGHSSKEASSPGAQAMIGMFGVTDEEEHGGEALDPDGGGCLGVALHAELCEGNSAAHGAQRDGGLGEPELCALASRCIPKQQQLHVVLHGAARVVVVKRQHHRLSPPPRPRGPLNTPARHIQPAPLCHRTGLAVSPNAKLIAAVILQATTGWF